MANKDTMLTYPEGWEEFLATLTDVEESQRDAYAYAWLKLVVDF